MSDGFLGFHASFMLDVVVTALVAIVPTLLLSIYLVKIKRKFLWHRNIQVTLGVVLLLTVAAFEYDLQIVHGGWENVVNKPGAAEPRLESEQLEFVRKVLWIHLVFAVSTPFLWAVTIVLALRRFPSPPVPGEHSGLHKKLGWLSAGDITLTSITGLIFYYLAFIQAQP